MRYLRARTGPDTVVITDSLTMAAASSGIGLTPEQSAVRALRAGADWALTCMADPMPTVAAIRGALDTGALSRDRAVTSARRLLTLKARAGPVHGPVGLPSVSGDTGVRYTKLRGLLGAPLTGEYAVPGGLAQRFERGQILWSAQTRAYDVSG